MPIDLHILAGSSAGRRLLLDQPVITIGRDATNDVVIDLPYVSRRHAELRFVDGAWHLINHSGNGTRLNRRWVRDEPSVIGEPATLGIGDEVVMELAPQGGGAGGAAGTAGTETGQPGAGTHARPGDGTNRRTKLWIGMGVYAVMMIGAMVFFATLSYSGGDEAPAYVPELTRAQIAEKVRRDIEPRAPDERRARTELRAAQELFARREVEIDARYQALEAFRLAQAYMPGQELSEIDRRRLRLLEQELIDDIAERYERAYSLMRSRQHEEGLRAFRQLQRLYPAGANDPLLENIDLHAAAARRAVQGDR